MKATAIASTLALLQLCSKVYAAVHEYDNQYMFSIGDAYIFRGGREGLYGSTKEALEKYGNWGQIAPGVANGQSEITFNKLQFHRPASVASQYTPDEGFTGLVQAVIFEVKDRDKIGFPTPQGYRYCCDKEIAKKTKCYQDRLIYKEGKDGWPRVLDSYFENNDTVAYTWEEAITIEKTGMYYLWFVTCDEDLASVTVSGATTWKNPGGYLPGMMYPNIRFFLFMTLAYIVLGTLWGIMYAVHRQTLFTLQHCISGIILLSLLEMGSWYVDYVNFNASGHRPVLLTLWAVLLGCFRKTFSRTLILIVSMGYGIVLPYLGAISKRVIALTSVYFISVCALDIVSNVGTIDDLTTTARILLVLPVAILDAIYIVWVFKSLSKTLAILQTRNATGKLQLYKRFTNTLALWVWISVAWIAYEMYYKVTDNYNERWQSDWVVSDFWHILNFLFLCILVWLWGPTSHSTRYAYSEQDAADEEYAMVEAGPTVGKKGTERSPYKAEHEGEFDEKMQ
jgi:hypothetical protein